MQPSKPLAIFLCTCVTLGAAGCGDIAADPIQAREPDKLASVGTNSEDPYACELIPTGATSGYWYRDVYTPLCKLTGELCLADGNASRTVDPVTELISNHMDVEMVCDHRCQADSDCPAPETGTAVATCLLPAEVSDEYPFGACVLSCDAGETCPDGFHCRESRGDNWPRSCVGKAVPIDWTGMRP
jgi:hypothetical protein